MASPRRSACWLTLLVLAGLGPAARADLYVSSIYSNEVLEYDETTLEFVRPFVTAGSGGLIAPHGLAFGPNGDLFVGSVSNEVLEYDGRTGAFVRAFVTAGSGGLSAPQGLAFGPNGNLFVSSMSSHEVLEYDGATGAFVQGVTFGGDLFSPAGLSFGTQAGYSSVLFVSSYDDGYVVAYDVASGSLLANYFVGPSPIGIAAATNGHLFLTAAGEQAVLELDPVSGVVSPFTYDSLGKPFGLAFGPNGRLYASSVESDSLMCFDGFGNLLALANGGKLFGPTYLAFGPASSPVPEPASVALLVGAGLLAGTGRVVVRRCRGGTRT